MAYVIFILLEFIKTFKIVLTDFEKIRQSNGVTESGQSDNSENTNPDGRKLKSICFQ